MHNKLRQAATLLLLLSSHFFSAVAFMHVCFAFEEAARGAGAGAGAEWVDGTPSCCSCCCCCCIAYLKAFIIEKVLRLCVAIAIAVAFHLTCRSHLIFHLEWLLSNAPLTPLSSLQHSTALPARCGSHRNACLLTWPGSSFAFDVDIKMPDKLTNIYAICFILYVYVGVGVAPRPIASHILHAACLHRAWQTVRATYIFTASDLTNMQF